MLYLEWFILSLYQELFVDLVLAVRIAVAVISCYYACHGVIRSLTLCML